MIFMESPFLPRHVPCHCHYRSHHQKRILNTFIYIIHGFFLAPPWEPKAGQGHPRTCEIPRIWGMVTKINTKHCYNEHATQKWNKSDQGRVNNMMSCVMVDRTDGRWTGGRTDRQMDGQTGWGDWLMEQPTLTYWVTCTRLKTLHWISSLSLSCV